MNELKAIADSQEPAKRLRGRMGLDVINKIQLQIKANIILAPDDFQSEEDVDSKLIKLALKMSGCIVTTDYNLNKVAAIHGIKILNVNDLSNAIKPMCVSGDNMSCL